jgi:glycosyltransferase involved in cell wall biosynthesis
MKNKSKKVFIVMPAYNVAELIEDVFKRIPKPVWKKISKVIIINDASVDQTLTVCKKLIKKYPKINLINKKQNGGYAKAQKTGFKRSLHSGADIVVLLHSDGQYAPEQLEKLLTPLEKDKADIVQGSRMLGGGALKGKMPVYKYIANVILSKLENWTYGMNVAEYHSGYMLYSKKALETIPFEKLSDTFHFDGEMIFMSKKMGLRFMEVPIPTTYAGETSNLKPVQYGVDVLRIMWNYKRGKYNF